MRKIIPWALPPVKGGSQGGYTPQPTPPVQDYPYDFDQITTTDGNVVITRVTNPIKYPMTRDMSISGVEILDDSEVSTITFYVSNAAGTVKYRQGSRPTVTENIAAGSNTVTVSKTAISDPFSISVLLKTLTGITGDPPSVTSVTGVELSITKIEVLNAAGTVIQTWEPETEEP